MKGILVQHVGNILDQSDISYFTSLGKKARLDFHPLYVSTDVMEQFSGHNPDIIFFLNESLSKDAFSGRLTNLVKNALTQMILYTKGKAQLLVASMEEDDVEVHIRLVTTSKKETLTFEFPENLGEISSELVEEIFNTIALTKPSGQLIPFSDLLGEVKAKTTTKKKVTKKKETIKTEVPVAKAVKIAEKKELKAKDSTSKLVNVKEIRGQLGLTMKDFAALVGVSPSTISSWERGNTEPNETNQDKLLDIKNKA